MSIRRFRRRRSLLRGLGAIALGATAAPLLRAAERAPASPPEGLAVGGEVYARGAERYEIMRQSAAWQALKPARYPDLIVQPRDEADVVETVRYAAARGMHVAVRSGGHSYVVAGLRDGGIHLDLSWLRDLDIDAAARRVTAGPAIRAAELTTALEAQGLAFPVAHVGTVGLGGYLLGGGMGWNGEYWNRYACFNVRAVDLVTAAGERLTASAASHPDLYWAARGAGPGFCAVATRFHLDAFPLPRAITASTYVYGLDALDAVTAWLERAGRNHHPKVELSLVLERDDTEAARHVAVVSAVCFADGAEEAQQILGALAAGVPRQGLVDHVELKPVGFPELLEHGRTGVPRRIAVDTVWTAQPRAAMLEIGAHYLQVPSRHAVVIGGYRAQVDLPDDAAFTVQAPLFINCFVGWDEAADDAANLAWLDQAVRRLEPLTVGSYINETDLFARPAHAKRALSPAAWERLAAVRGRYDPEGLFAAPI
jgi:FAD/FMN-containing dehydrogenase